MNTKKKDVLAIATYKMQDWQRLREISDDKTELEDTWQEWHDSMLKSEDILRRKGIKYKEELIDLNELMEYCEKNRLKVNSESRSRFVAHKLMMTERK